MTTKELDKQRDKIFNEYYASLIELIGSAGAEHPAIGEHKLDVGLEKITKKLISDCIDAVVPEKIIAKDSNHLYYLKNVDKEPAFVARNKAIDEIQANKRNLLGEK